MIPSRGIPAPIAALDGARLRLFRLFMPLSSRLAAHREERVAVLASLQILVSFLAAWLIPLPLVAWGTLALGVPHILSGARHLVFNTGYARHKIRGFAIGAPVLLAAFGGGVKVALFGVMAASWVSRGTLLTRAAVFLTAATASILCWHHPRSADLAFAHAHNFVAAAFFWSWRKRRGPWRFVPPALFTAACAAIMAGLAPTPGAASGPGYAVLVNSLAPGSTPTLGPRLVTLFAFAQSVHYGVWLRLIPDESRSRRSSQTFARSWTEWKRDCGPIPITGAALFTAFFCVWGAFDPWNARDGYLRFAGFHGYAELAVLALFLTEGRSRAGLV